MPMKTLLAALSLVAGLAPALAAAQGCDHDRQAQMSCAQGQAWDADAKRCVTVGS